MTRRLRVAQKVVGIALSVPGTVVFGGYVRDVTVRNSTSFNDVDLCFSTKDNMRMFVNIVKISMNAKVAKETEQVYPNTMCVVRLKVPLPFNKYLQVDCVYTKHSCADFSCNMIRQDAHSLRVCKGHSSYFLHEIVSACRRREFFALPPKTMMCDRAYVHHTINAIRRACQLVNSSWTMAVDAQRPSFVVRRGSGEQCNICHGDIGSGERAFVTKCDHAFHVGCVTKWLESTVKSAHGANLGCPVCRRERCYV